MVWNEDDENTNKRMLPKLGRRANQNNRQSSEEFGSTDDTLEFTEQIASAPIGLRKAGGWADETLKSGKNKSSINLIEQERFQEQKTSFDDDIPVIPDIDEIPDDVLIADVAHAPSVSVNRVTTYKELDKDLLKQNTFSQFGDINLSHLTRFMYNETDIRDPDEVWTKEFLFNELISEYRGSVEDI